LANKQKPNCNNLQKAHSRADHHKIHCVYATEKFINAVNKSVAVAILMDHSSNK